MQPNKFQFVLNIEGNDEEILSQAPEGWLNTTVTYKRNQTYQGLFRGLTTPSKYVTKGAYLCRRQFYKNGVNAFVKNIIRQLNPATWQYNDIYNGRLDFSNCTDELASFTVNSISDDFSVQLKANEDTAYAFDLDVAEAINLELTPLLLDEVADYTIGEYSSILVGGSFLPVNIANYEQHAANPSAKSVPSSINNSPTYSTDTNWFFQANATGKVHITGYISWSSVGTTPIHIRNQSGTIIYTFANSNKVDFILPVSLGDKWFLRAEGSVLLSVTSGQLSFAYKTSTPATMCKALPANYVFGELLRQMNENTDSGIKQPVPFNSTLLTGLLKDLVITTSDSIKLALGSLFVAGQTLYPGSYKVIAGSVVYASTTYNLGDTFTYNGSTLTFSGGGTAQRIVSDLIGSVYSPGDTLQAGGTYVAGGNPGTYVIYNSHVYNVGQFFDYVLGQETFTGSDDSSYVQQTGIKPQMILSFKDFFQSIYGVMGGNCAFGIEKIGGVNRCFIESLDYVYRGTIGNLNAGIVDTNITIQPATDMIPNTIKVGYKDQQYGQLNGFLEVNSFQLYSTSLVNPKKELDLTSVIRADPYGIEELRISQNDTAASRSDNDNFFVWKLSTPSGTVPFDYYHPLRTETLTSITGVDPSYYNWKLSPKQNMDRGGPYLASLFYKMDGYSIRLKSAPKNTGMVTVENGVRIAEGDPMQIANLGTPLFYPFYCTFKPGLVNGALQMIDNIPYGFMSFVYNGVTYKMFLDTINIDIGQNTQQEFKGILTTGNDLTTLIH